MLTELGIGHGDAHYLCRRAGQRRGQQSREVHVLAAHESQADAS